MVNKETAIILFVLIMLSFAHTVNAVGIGASPATLSFILNNNSEEKTFQVSTNSESSVSFTVKISDSLKDIIKITPDSGETKINQPAEIIVKASKFKTGNYSGTINIKTLPATNKAEEGTGSQVSTGVVVKVDVEIPEKTESSFKDKLTSLLTGRSILGQEKLSIGWDSMIPILIILGIVLITMIIILFNKIYNRGQKNEKGHTNNFFYFNFIA